MVFARLSSLRMSSEFFVLCILNSVRSALPYCTTVISDKRPTPDLSGEDCKLFWKLTKQSQLEKMFFRKYMDRRTTIDVPRCTLRMLRQYPRSSCKMITAFLRQPFTEIIFLLLCNSMNRPFPFSQVRGLGLDNMGFECDGPSYGYSPP